ncbi:MAG: hypothetical protein MUE55_08385 [Thermoplasmata archaeon]|jgi:uncharacterized membrane protein|nr:hypothetical protein [Thermoplasmata archaeon]
MACVLGMLTSAAVIALMANRALAHPDGDPWSALDPVGWAILVTGVGGFAMSSALLVHSRYLISTIASSPKAVPDAGRTDEAQADAQKGTSEPPAERDLTALPVDERRLYDRIEEAGGEILQMNLVASGEFSKSKVTRLLDRLESRGLIVRERKGMTNRIRLVR